MKWKNSLVLQPGVDVPPGAKDETEVREGKSGRISKGRKARRENRT